MYFFKIAFFPSILLIFYFLGNRLQTNLCEYYFCFVCPFSIFEHNSLWGISSQLWHGSQSLKKCILGTSVVWNLQPAHIFYIWNEFLGPLALLSQLSHSSWHLYRVFSVPISVHTLRWPYPVLCILVFSSMR